MTRFRTAMPFPRLALEFMGSILLSSGLIEVAAALDLGLIDLL